MASPQHVLALDQGTTSSRAIVFAPDGSVVAVAQKEFEQHFPAPGLVEHDPEEIWATQVGVAGEALARARLGRDDVAAVGITNQRETVVLWERDTLRPVHRALVWQDRRTADLCAELRAQGLTPKLRQRTGLVVDPYFSGTKIRWLLDHVPGARERAERGELVAGTVDAWLIARLTGGAVTATDVSNASRTMLMDLRTNAWDDEMCRALDVPREVLPRIVPSAGVVGEVTGAAGGSALAGLPIAGIAGDQQAALFGHGCTAPGEAKNTYGTGCFLLWTLGEEPRESANRLLTTVAWKLGADGPTTYAFEGSIFVGGAVVQWLRDGLGLIRTAAEVEALAARVPDAGGVHLVPAFTGLGAPWWDADARGLMCGITRGTTAAHLARAALDSIALQTRDLVDAMERDVGWDGGRSLRSLRVDGGATANDLLMQIQADLLQVPVERPAVTETTALGAAVLAGLGSGAWSTDELEAARRIERRFEPTIPEAEASERVARWHEAVARASSDRGASG